jgi:Fe-S-cluster containining protein
LGIRITAEESISYEEMNALTSCTHKTQSYENEMFLYVLLYCIIIITWLSIWMDSIYLFLPSIHPYISMLHVDSAYFYAYRKNADNMCLFLAFLRFGCSFLKKKCEAKDAGIDDRRESICIVVFLTIEDKKEEGIARCYRMVHPFVGRCFYSF